MNSKLKVLVMAMMATGTIACTQSVDVNNATVETKVADRYTNLEADVENLLSQLTLEEKVSLVHANSKFAIASVERLGIHEMWMSDGPHGVRQEVSRDSWKSAGWTDDQSTYLPPLTTVAASWNPEMSTLHGNVLGAEARHRRKDVILGPGVNLARLPTYGRNFEYFGEDPYLASVMVIPEIKAIQANDVAANLKHYALNTQELNRQKVDAIPDERTLREVYLPVFEAGVKEAGVYTIMGAYNSFRGTNANQSKYLVNDILKGEWGFDGILLTDWDVNINTYDAAMNGLDIEMGTRADSYDDYKLAKPFLKMLKEGKIPVAVLDDKVRRILRIQLRIGMMDKSRLSGQRNIPEHRAAARKIAEEGIVLLKNEGILPLAKDEVKNILVLGPNTDREHGKGGGSSQVKSLYEISPIEGLQAKLGDDVNITFLRTRPETGIPAIAGDYIIKSNPGTGTPAWQVSNWKEKARKNWKHWSWVPDSAYTAPADSTMEHVTMKTTIKPLESGVHTLKLSAVGDFRLKVNGKKVLEHSSTDGAEFNYPLELSTDKEYKFEMQYDGNKNFVLGWDAPSSLFSTKEEYIAAAKAADAVIYFGGLSHADDRESQDRVDMKLPNGQDEVITNLLAANPDTVIFLNAGSAVEMPWVNNAKAIMWGWYGGMEGGHAYADALFGDVNPSGKMPITLPVALEDTAAIALNDYNSKESFYKEGVFIGYRWFEQQNIEPIFPFGHGLSYTTFSYDNVELSSASISAGDELEVTVTVTNTGKVAGSEIVQLYLNDVQASVERPAKELKGFGKVHLQPGETKTVSMTLKQRDLSFWDVNTNDWLAEPGQFDVLIGASHTDIKLNTSFQYQ
ncbi:glycoside hydrolase family 3 C-terminal domain-containing protein [Thalassomonas sp. M1454]|uniref:glycoside hydrolase family 3 C-terminal domain-containing protein n=1 Tax=Thalassomonas sp. M1454 TaxID=2594477 RepID=UPI00117C5F96|nr:glycoside hydrolase family 3 C-terminal domain-containing protein [Thalassomonas sp. M1454]TRX53942.1 glycosyl hydrolase [Thalassomonas sp. M1454]